MKRALAGAAALSIALAAQGQEKAAEKKTEGFWDAKKSAWVGLTAAQKDQAFQFAEDYKRYLDVARTADGSTREVIRLAKAAGFSEFKDAGQVKPGAKLWINGRDRALILVVVGSDPIVAGSRLVGTHHDSPHIDLKARPLYLSGGFALFNTVYYGGIKKYQWANRPLALVGRVDTTDGKRIDVSIGLKDGDPTFVIADNAPHSDKPLRERKYTEVLSGQGARSGRRQHSRRRLLRRRAGDVDALVHVRPQGAGLRLLRARSRTRRAPAGRGHRPRPRRRLRPGRPAVLLLRRAGGPRSFRHAEENGDGLPVRTTRRRARSTTPAPPRSSSTRRSRSSSPPSAAASTRISTCARRWGAPRSSRPTSTTASIPSSRRRASPPTPRASGTA